MDEPKEAWVIEFCPVGQEDIGPWTLETTGPFERAEVARNLVNGLNHGEYAAIFTFRPRRYVPAEE